jgi:hypothetical protein
MFYVLERTRKTLDELKSRLYPEVVSVKTFQMKEGNFSSPAEADAAAAEWKTYNTGDKWGGRDTHAWFRVAVKVPDRFDGRTAELFITLYIFSAAPTVILVRAGLNSNILFIYIFSSPVVKRLEVASRIWAAPVSSPGTL